jgi:hypothetical protein
LHTSVALSLFHLCLLPEPFPFENRCLARSCVAAAPPTRHERRRPQAFGGQAEGVAQSRCVREPSSSVCLSPPRSCRCTHLVALFPSLRVRTVYHQPRDQAAALLLSLKPAFVPYLFPVGSQLMMVHLSPCRDISFPGRVHALNVLDVLFQPSCCPC